MAQRLAGESVSTFLNGVWLVQLAPVADAGLVPQVVASELGVHEQPGRPMLTSLSDALIDRPDPPHTNMMHVYLQASSDALLEARDEIARTERVALFRRLQPIGVPGVSAFELSIGDAIEALCTGRELREVPETA